MTEKTNEKRRRVRTATSEEMEKIEEIIFEMQHNIIALRKYTNVLTTHEIKRLNAIDKRAFDFSCDVAFRFGKILNKDEHKATMQIFKKMTKAELDELRFIKAERDAEKTLDAEEVENVREVETLMNE